MQLARYLPFPCCLCLLCGLQLVWVPVLPWLQISSSNCYAVAPTKTRYRLTACMLSCTNGCSPLLQLHTTIPCTSSYQHSQLTSQPITVNSLHQPLHATIAGGRVEDDTLFCDGAGPPTWFHNPPCAYEWPTQPSDALLLQLRVSLCSHGSAAPGLAP